MKKKFNLSELLSKVPSKRLRYSLIIGVIGIVLLLFSSLKSTPKQNNLEQIRQNHSQQIEKTNKEVPLDTDLSYIKEVEENYEKDLERMLNEVRNLSEVEVMINLDSSNIQVYEQNLIIGKQITDESDTNGGTRAIEDQTEEVETVIIRNGEQEVPLLVHTKKPQVRGVLIVGHGVENIETKQSVIESVSKVLSIPTHKVSVIPK